MWKTLQRRLEIGTIRNNDSAAITSDCSRKSNETPGGRGGWTRSTRPVVEVVTSDILASTMHAHSAPWSGSVASTKCGNKATVSLKQTCINEARIVLALPDLYVALRYSFRERVDSHRSLIPHAE